MLMFVFLAGFNPLRKISPLFPQKPTNFSQLSGRGVAVFCDSGDR